MWNMTHTVEAVMVLRVFEGMASGLMDDLSL